MKNIVIAGGGTAGWLTALYVKQICPTDSITLIESDKIGVIGVGEGTTPLLSTTLKSLGLDINDLIKECNATIKLGVKFENWNGDGKSYFSPLLSNNDFTIKDPLSIGIYENGEILHYINAITNGESIEEYSFVTQLANNDKSPIAKDGDNYILTSNFSFQFDSTLLTNYLRKCGIERGINRVEGIITKINSNNDGSISSISIDDTKYKTDFVFDCTGFHRLIIGNHYGINWKSYKDKLKVNTAIPFFLPIDETIPTYITATAMKYGWMWKTPLQNRYGCGYIFDNKFISVEEAKKEVEEYFGYDIDFIKTIPFDAGRYEKFWVKNCIGIGLSTIFSEPLEATAIWAICNQLLNVSKKGLYECDEDTIDEYNNFFGKLMDYTIDWLQFHYFTKRNDTDFWKNYKESTTISPQLLQKLKMWKKRTPNWDDLGVIHQNAEINVKVWLTIAIGIGYIPKEIFVKENELYDLDNKIEQSLMKHKEYIDGLVKQSISHNELLELVKNNKLKIQI